MPARFDPYHTWLGIPPEKQPPNHYDLLGVPLFEDKPEVIEAAADRQMGHLRTYQAGKHVKLSQKLLNEVVAARLCLLNPQEKAAYDQKLRNALQVAPPAKPARRKHTGETTTKSTEFNQLGEYRLLEKLGEGGMGAVYKALHTKLGRQVALKVLPKQRVEDEKAIARFEREMRAVGQLDHTNVVRAHDAREIGGTCFLVMELVHGMDLARFVREYGPLQAADACEVIRQAALGLQCAHEHGLVHRDVKPSNLMLTQDGQVKLLDLGLARFQAGQSAADEMTTAGQALGTLDYMAPEQISSTHTVDIRADIYSLGCTLYKLLTGQAPFSGPRYQTSYDKMRGHLQDPIPRIQQFREDVPGELVAVINRMVAKEPGLRFGSPAEVAHAVGPLAADSVLSGLLAGAEHKPPMVRPSKSLVGTEKSFSSSLTRFLERIRVKPPAAPPGAGQPRTNVPVILGAVGLGLLLLAGVVVWGLFFAAGPPKEAALIFDWPAEVRKEVKLLVDDQTATFPRSEGPIEYRCQPGEHRIVAKRLGFKRWERVVTLQAGHRQKITPHWQPQSYLVLQWPATQRHGAQLEIDGHEQDLSDLTPRPTRIQVKVALEAGSHKVRITRAGFEPFEQTVAIEDEKDFTVEPDWQRLSGQTVAGPSEPKQKLPVPSEDAQRTIAGQIYGFYGTADAKTAAEKIAVARKMLEAGKGPKDNPIERYVLLHGAAQLATEGCEAPLMQEAVDALAARFEVEPAEMKQTALARIAEIEEADRQAQAAQEEAAKKAEAERRREERYAKALEAAEAKVAAWDFQGALAALAQLAFADDEQLTARLARRRDELRRVAGLKAKMTAKINAARPPLKKSDLMIRGLAGDVTKADEDGITATLITEKSESYAWGKLGEEARQRLLQLAVDRDSPDDWLAAGLLAMGCQDVALAEKLFAKAASLGVKIESYLDPLAATAFAKAKGHLDKGEFHEADAVLDSIAEKYANTPWFTSKKPAFDAARAEAKTGILETEAEKLYAEAVKLYSQQQLFDLRPLVEKLKTDYAQTRLVTDTYRKPSLAEMEEAVADLGRFITVRQDGKGEFTSIQEAINAAPPNSLVEIQDGGPYNEKVIINKDGLTVRGKKGCWPIITSVGPRTNFPILLQVSAREITIERLVLAHGAPAGDRYACLAQGSAGQMCIRSTIAYIYYPQAGSYAALGTVRNASLENCILFGPLRVEPESVVRNSIALRLDVKGGKLENMICRGLKTETQCRLRFCTIPAAIRSYGEPSEFVDCIIGSVESSVAGNRIENCNVYRKPPFIDEAKPGKNCFSADPQFVNPKGFDYRLMPNSPCRGKASDGGDVGVRYTPEMIQMLKLALELRAKGIIQF